MSTYRVANGFLLVSLALTSAEMARLFSPSTKQPIGNSSIRAAFRLSRNVAPILGPPDLAMP